MEACLSNEYDYNFTPIRLMLYWIFKNKNQKPAEGQMVKTTEEKKRKTENNSKPNAIKKASKVKAFVTDSFSNCLHLHTPPAHRTQPNNNDRFTLEQHLFFRFISRVSVSLCQLSAAAADVDAACNAFTSCFCFCFIFHTIRHATHVRHALPTTSPICPSWPQRELFPNVSFMAAPPTKDLFVPIQMICEATAVFKPHWRPFESEKLILKPVN